MRLVLTPRSSRVSSNRARAESAAGCVIPVPSRLGVRSPQTLAVFTTHFFPLYVLRSPADMVGRFQSVLIEVQMVAMLGNLAVGSAVSRWGVETTLLVAALVCALAVVPVAVSTVLRRGRAAAVNRQ